MAKHAQPTPRPQRAFTLVELMIVIGIIMMLVAISAPLLSTMAQRQALEGAVELTTVEFMQLRERAATTGMPVVSVFEHWTDPMRLMSWSPLYDEEEERWVWMLVSAQRMPEGVWAHDHWLDEVTDMEESTELPSGLAYRDAIYTLLVQDHGNEGFYSFPAPPEEVENEVFDGFEIRRERRRCYALVFMPEGTLHMIGRPNVPITDLHVVDPQQEDPDGDFILTNGDEVLYMCVNPATARIEWTKGPYRPSE